MVHILLNTRVVDMNSLLECKLKPTISISTMERRNVIVVGAGIAGIAAARKLNEDGRFNVKILEASNRIGGRIFSSVIDGIPVELGATYIHGTIDNVIYDLSKQYGIVEENSDKDDDKIDVLASPVLLSNGEVVPNEIVIKCWGKFDELLEDMYTSDKAPMWASMYEDMHAYLVSEYPKRLENDPDTRDVLKTPYSNSMFEFFLNKQSNQCLKARKIAKELPSKMITLT